MILPFWIRAVFAAASAAISPLQMIFFSENHQSIFIYIIILFGKGGTLVLFIIHGLAFQQSLYLGQN